MNPKPLLALNHFTVPCSLTDVLPSFRIYLCFSSASSRKAKEAASVNLQPLQSNLKVLQEQQTQIKNSMLPALSLVEFWRLLDAIDFSLLRDRPRRPRARLQIYSRARHVLLRDGS